MQKYRLVLVTFPNGVEHQVISKENFTETQVMDEACCSAFLARIAEILSSNSVDFLANVAKCRETKKPFIMIQEADDE